MRGGARVRRVLAEEMARRTRRVGGGDDGGGGGGGGNFPAGTSKAPGLNFPPGEYRDLVPALDSMSLEGVIAAVRQGKLREHRA